SRYDRGTNGGQVTAGESSLETRLDVSTQGQTHQQIWITEAAGFRDNYDAVPCAAMDVADRKTECDPSDRVELIDCSKLRQPRECRSPCDQNTDRHRPLQQFHDGIVESRRSFPHADHFPRRIDQPRPCALRFQARSLKLRHRMPGADEKQIGGWSW